MLLLLSYRSISSFIDGRDDHGCSIFNTTILEDLCHRWSDESRSHNNDSNGDNHFYQSESLYLEFLSLELVWR